MFASCLKDNCVVTCFIFSLKRHRNGLPLLGSKNVSLMLLCRLGCIMFCLYGLQLTKRELLILFHSGSGVRYSVPFPYSPLILVLFFSGLHSAIWWLRALLLAEHACNPWCCRRLLELIILPLFWNLIQMDLVEWAPSKLCKQLVPHLVILFGS